jgi:hypothetical protein
VVKLSQQNWQQQQGPARVLESPPILTTVTQRETKSPEVEAAEAGEAEMKVEEHYRVRSISQHDLSTCNCRRPPQSAPEVFGTLERADHHDKPYRLDPQPVPATELGSH